MRIGDSLTAGYTHGHWFKDEMAKAGVEWKAQGTRPSWYWEDDYNWNEGWGGCTIQWFKNYQTTYTNKTTETLNKVLILFGKSFFLFDWFLNFSCKRNFSYFGIYNLNKTINNIYL